MTLKFILTLALFLCACGHQDDQPLDLDNPNGDDPTIIIVDDKSEMPTFDQPDSSEETISATNPFENKPCGHHLYQANGAGEITGGGGYTEYTFSETYIEMGHFWARLDDERRVTEIWILGQQVKINYHYGTWHSKGRNGVIKDEGTQIRMIDKDSGKEEILVWDREHLSLVAFVSNEHRFEWIFHMNNLGAPNRHELWSKGRLLSVANYSYQGKRMATQFLTLHNPYSGESNRVIEYDYSCRD